MNFHFFTYLNKRTYFSIQATKILIYSPTCQPLSSSKKPLIKHIDTIFLLKIQKNNIKKLNSYRKSYYYFIFVLIKLSFIFYTQRTNEKEHTSYWLCFGANTSFPFNAK